MKSSDVILGVAESRIAIGTEEAANPACVMAMIDLKPARGRYPTGGTCAPLVFHHRIVVIISEAILRKPRGPAFLHGLALVSLALIVGTVVAIALTVLGSPPPSIASITKAACPDRAIGVAFRGRQVGQFFRHSLRVGLLPLTRVAGGALALSPMRKIRVTFSRSSGLRCLWLFRLGLGALLPLHGSVARFAHSGSEMASLWVAVGWSHRRGPGSRFSLHKSIVPVFQLQTPGSGQSAPSGAQGGAGA